jgi:dolichol-phosphate mannosyltransferase
MILSVVIPAYNEEGSITETIVTLYEKLVAENIPHEIFVTNDNSKDGTAKVLADLCKTVPTLRWETNLGPNGFGYAVRYGLDRFSGDCVAVMMADLSDSPEDLVLFYRTLVSSGKDCVFGTRFTKGGQVYDYPTFKLFLNRLTNWGVRMTFQHGYDDTTNAFKLYKKEVISGIKPLMSPHFNLTLEMPLKAVIRGFSFEVVGNSWRNRKHGESKLKIKEMGSRYFFIFLYCLIEKFFSQGDFKRKHII